MQPVADFAFRNIHWECAPVVSPPDGVQLRNVCTLGYNIGAIQGGYLTRNGDAPQHLDDIATDLWWRQAVILYHAINHEGNRQRAYLFEAPGRDLYRFDDGTGYEGAIRAHQALQKARAQAKATMIES